jgi:SAM-dependent methyltransferase
VDASKQSDRRPCPLCTGLGRKLLFRREIWDVVECLHCGMVFIGRELDYAAQLQDHDWSDEHPKEVARRNERHPVLMFFSRLTRPMRPDPCDRLLAHVVHWRSEGRLVDFGSGAGKFLQRAAPHFDLAGVEISPHYAKLSGENAPTAEILVGPVTEVAGKELPEESFDVVTQFGYIEHEWQPLEGLRAAYRVLKPGGITVIKTPNYACWNRRVMGLDWCGYHVPAHCNYFTLTTLSALLRQAGFDPLPRPLADRLPTSDSLWLAAQKPE